MYTRMVLMVVFWCYRMAYDAHGCVSTLMNVTYAKILIERDKSINECRFIKMNVFSRLLKAVCGINQDVQERRNRTIHYPTTKHISML